MNKDKFFTTVNLSNGKKAEILEVDALKYIKACTHKEGAVKGLVTYCAKVDGKLLTDDVLQELTASDAQQIIEAISVQLQSPIL